MALAMLSNKDRGNLRRRIFAGITVCILSVTVNTAAVATLVSAGTVKEDSVNIWMILVHFISIILGSTVVMGKNKDKRLVTSLFVGVLYIAVLLSITALFLDGMYQGVLVTMFVVISGCFAATIVNNSVQKAGKPKLSRKRRC